MSDAIRRQFHAQLAEVKSEIVHLGALAMETIPRATAALLNGDLKAAQSLIDDDDIIDVKSIAIEDECMRLFALQQPMAGDLRSLMTAIKLNWDIERSADLSVNIGKAVRRIYGVELPPSVRGVVERNTLRYYLAIDAFLEAQALPAPQQLQASLQGWFTATERYAQQLHEVDRDTYVGMKLREVQRQRTQTAPAAKP